MHDVRRVLTESNLPVLNPTNESAVKVPVTMTSTSIVSLGDGVRGGMPKVGSPLRRPLEMSRSMAGSPGGRGGVEEEDLDEELAELASLRCPSLQTEEIAMREREKKERQARRNSRSADYPGLAFGSAMFGSDTTMKLKIIQNELHNIMRSQLRRVEGEVTALSTRVKKFDSDLEQSEKYIKTATAALADAVQWEMEHRKDSQEEEEESNAISQFDAQLRLLEWKLMQAKILASGEEKGEIDDSVTNFEIREESKDRNLAAISAASCENTNIELKCQISIHDEEESTF